MPGAYYRSAHQELFDSIEAPLHLADLTIAQANAVEEVLGALSADDDVERRRVIAALADVPRLEPLERLVPGELASLRLFLGMLCTLLFPLARPDSFSLDPPLRGASRE